jgi:Family of unknown function (DUF6152)
MTALRTSMLLAALIYSAGGTAHHSFSMFDTSRTVELKGTVRGFEWTNPHVWIQIVVDSTDSTRQEWSVEGPSPNRLAREGWKSSTLRPGDKITLTSNPLRSGQPGGSLVRVTLADGRVLGLKAAGDEYGNDKAK